MEKSLYKTIVITLIIGIALVLLFSVYMRYKIMDREGYSELYFEEYEDLPEKIIVDESFNVSVVVSNQERYAMDYILEAESAISNFSKEISLEPGENAVFDIEIIALDKGWELVFAEKISYSERISDFGAEITVSHNVDWFGEIFHTNLSVDDLKEDSFEKYYEFNSTGIDESVYSQQNITVYFEDDEIVMDSYYEEYIHKTIGEKPFTVKLYKPGDELEIYFWYEIV